MNKSDIKEGHIYQMKHLGQVANVRVNTIEEREGGRIGNSRRYRHITRYYCTKLATGRNVIVKSAVKFLYDVTEEAKEPED